MNVEDAVGGVHLPKDGQGDPVNITQALAKGARNGGAKIFEGVKVTDIITQNGVAAATPFWVIISVTFTPSKILAPPFRAPFANACVILTGSPCPSLGR